MKPNRIGFLDHVEQTGHRPSRIEFCLERCQVGWIGLRVQWRQRDPATALVADVEVRIFLQAAIQDIQRLPHFVLQLGDETICIEREIQCFVVFVAVCLKIGGQILIRVAITIGADDPDFLAAQLFTQGFQYGYLVGDTINAITAGRVLFNHGVAPEDTHDTIERHLLVGRECPHLAVGEPLHKFQRLHDRAMAFVVGAKL